MAVGLEYPNIDDLEHSDAGSGPVQLRAPMPRRPVCKLEQSFTFYGGGQLYPQGSFALVNNSAAGWVQDTSETGWMVVIDNGTTQRYPVHAKTADKLKTIYSLDRKDNTRRHGLDVIVDYLDDWLNEGGFDKCNALLLAAEPDQLSDPAIVTFLGITRAAKNLPAMYGRGIFFRRAYRVMEQRRGKAGADQLLTKYR